MGSIMGSQNIMGSDYGSNISASILKEQHNCIYTESFHLFSFDEYVCYDSFIH
jgi:hypothetical protein